MQKSYIIYCIVIFVAALLAGIAQLVAKKDQLTEKIKLNKLLWYSSMFLLVFVMAFRTIGVASDDDSYVTIFNNVIELGPFQYFLQSRIEFGYLFVNYIVSLITDNYFVLSFIVTLVPMFLFYKALEYEANHLNLFIGVFIFGTTMYLYFFGITRLFIAVSIVVFAYRYIFEKKLLKYIISILIAGMFHYSAFFMLFFVYFITERKGKERSLKRVLPIMLILMPLLIIFVNNYVFPNMGYRYTKYMNIGQFSLSIDKFDKLPFLVLAVIFQNKISKFNKNIRIYTIIYAITIVISMYTSVMDLGRIQWYMTFPICIILSDIAKALYYQRKEIAYLYNLLVIVYGLIYAYRITMNTTIMEYQNIFFI